MVLLRGFNVRGWDNIHDLWSSVAYQILKAAKTGGSVYSIAPVNDLSKVRQVQRSALNLWISKDPGHGSPELAMPEPLLQLEEEVKNADLFVLVPEIPPVEVTSN